jgi:hypothetical protein
LDYEVFICPSGPYRKMVVLKPVVGISLNVVLVDMGQPSKALWVACCLYPRSNCQGTKVVLARPSFSLVGAHVRRLGSSVPPCLDGVQHILILFDSVMHGRSVWVGLAFMLAPRLSSPCSWPGKVIGGVGTIVAIADEGGQSIDPLMPTPVVKALRWRCSDETLSTPHAVRG